MRTQLLVPINTFPSGNGPNLALHVRAIARHLNADVHAVVITPLFPTVSSPLGNLLIDVPSLVGGARAKSRERGTAVRSAMAESLGSVGIPFRATEMECTMGALGESFIQATHYCDVVVVGTVTGDANLHAAAELTIFGSGRPTLLVAEEEPPPDFGHVMIAWDGSKVAARAVSDARDFLDRATTVTIASVVDEKALPDDDPGSKLADYLNRRGVATSVARIQAQGRPIAEVLQACARDRGVGLLVMGAFGHSRLRDFVLGGATQGILKKPLLSVLLSH